MSFRTGVSVLYCLFDPTVLNLNSCRCRTSNVLYVCVYMSVLFWGGGQGLSRYLEKGCPNRGFIDFCVSKVWYKIHTSNKIDPIPLQILLF